MSLILVELLPLLPVLLLSPWFTLVVVASVVARVVLGEIVVVLVFVPLPVVGLKRPLLSCVISTPPFILIGSGFGRCVTQLCNHFTLILSISLLDSRIFGSLQE